MADITDAEIDELIGRGYSNEEIAAVLGDEPEPVAPSKPSLLGLTGQAVGSSISDGIDGLLNLPSTVKKGYDYITSPKTQYAGGLTNRIASDLVENPEMIAPALAGAGTAITGAVASPAAGAMSYPVFQSGARGINEILGLTKPLTPEEEYQQTIKDTTGSLIPQGISSALDKMALKVPVGTKKDRALQALSKRDDAVTDALGATKRTTDAEIANADNIAKYEDNFIRRSGLMDADPKDPNALLKINQNLDGLTEEGSSIKNSILQSADEAYAKKLSGKETNSLLREAKSPSGISARIGQIDKILKQEGAYDSNVIASAVRNPSAIPDVKALQAERIALSKELDSLLEPIGLKSAYLQANDNMATGIRYGDLTNRTRGETGQALAPEQARSLIDGVGQVPDVSARGVINKGLDLLAGDKETRRLAQAVDREGNVISNAQKIVNYRNGQPVEPTALDKGIANVNAAQKQIPQALRLAQTGGAVNAADYSGLPGYTDPYPKGLPRKTETIDPDTFIPEVLRRTKGDPVAQELLSEMTKAFKSQDRYKLEMMHENLTRAYPDLFESGYGVNGRIYSLDEQNKYMKRLGQLKTEGRLTPKIIALQQNKFFDKNDLGIIPLDNYLDVNPREQLKQSAVKNKARVELDDGTFAPTY
jgi:hypothetical protein